MDFLKTAKEIKEKGKLDNKESRELLKNLQKLNPYSFWIPYKEQEEFTRAKNRMRLFVGGNRIGKTEAGIMEDISWCLGYRYYLEKDDPDFKCPFEPPVHGLITTESLGTEGTAKKVIENKLTEFIPKEELKSTKKNQQGVTVFYEFKNGSTISVMAYEQDIEKFEGFRIHFWHGDEPPKKKIYGAISRGLVDFLGWAWITMTPVASEAFTIELFENPNNFRIGPIDMRCNLKHVRDWYGQKMPTGALTIEGINDFERQLIEGGMDPAEVEARITGKFKFLSGRILPFTIKNHIIEPFEIKPGEGTMYIAIDPHDYKPWYISFMIAHKNGNRYTVDELRIKGSLVEINSAIQDRLSIYKMIPHIMVIDPSAIIEESDQENLIQKLFKESRDDIYPLRLQKASRGEAPKRQGIQLWRQEMNFNEDKGEYPSWYVFNTCTFTIKQVNSWVYDDKGYAMKDDDDFCENHYRLFNLNPMYVQKRKESDKNKRQIIGIGG